MDEIAKQMRQEIAVIDYVRLHSRNRNGFVTVYSLINLITSLGSHFCYLRFALLRIILLIAMRIML